jgi:hypothetical protein
MTRTSRAEAAGPPPRRLTNAGHIFIVQKVVDPAGGRASNRPDAMV